MLMRRKKREFANKLNTRNNGDGSNLMNQSLKAETITGGLIGIRSFLINFPA